MNLHPHLHFLLTKGGVAKNDQLFRNSNFNNTLLNRFSTREVFSLLLPKQLILSSIFFNFCAFYTR
ncbi:MAG: transposase [Candidatus Aminicenantaceae bacterium]